MAETDVVVVGSGCAGLTAALTAAVNGARVTVLERSSVFGGTTAISGGGMWLPCNGLDPDFPDSAEAVKAYLRRLTMGYTPEPVIERYLDESAKVPEFLAKHTPLTFIAEKGRPDYHAPWEGSSNTSRTVFATLYDLNRLGELQDRVRKPRWPGGIPPIQHDEETRDLAHLEQLIEERRAKGIAARGLALVGGLLEGCVANGVTLLSDVRVTSLVTDENGVRGVRTQQGPDSTTYDVTAGVVLATGGFEWNKTMWDAFIRAPWDGPASPPYNEGDSLQMAARAGARLASLHHVTWIPARSLGETYEGRPYMRTSIFGGAPGEILVNRKGQRFANECLNYNDIGYAMTRFDTHTYEFVNHPCFVIADDRRRHAMVAPTDGAAAEADDLVEGSTLRELAEKLGVDPDGLEEQVRVFNEHAAQGEDPAFHRGEKPWELHIQPALSGTGEVADLPNPALAPLVKPPFLGHRVRAGVFGTRGGPVINENAQVLDYANRPIGGLFGAGNAVAHPFGPAYPGGGGTLGPAATFGRVAGQSVSATG